MRSPQRSVELFHLFFLRHLNDKLEKGLYAVKGGCNLRFFLKSIRYSEDLDIDAKTISKETLRNKVSKLLGSPPFRQALSARGLEIDRISEVKQTETTQRWKVQIKVTDLSLALPTKIEFSRRGIEEDVVFEPVDPELIRSHQLYPILANHYTQNAALRQKIDALIHRTEVQARDVFDIQLLIQGGATLHSLSCALREKLGIAIERVYDIEFSAFTSQVVSFLMDEYQEYYRSPQVWADLQTSVGLRLEEAQLR